MNAPAQESTAAAAGTEEAGFPATREELRDRVSSSRWRVYETATGIIEEIDQTIDWERLYDVDGPLQEFLTWGLFLEECIPAAVHRIRATLKEAAGDERAEPKPAELEDDVFWGTKQIEGGMQQALSILSRKMVDLLTTCAEPLPEDVAEKATKALCVPIADTAGKLRSDLRRFAAFIVAGGTWDSDEVEVLLYPQKMDELQKGQVLKEHLVETMEGFQGSEQRLPISDVLRLWRNGKVLGTSALVEVDTLLGSLGDVLERTNRRALYVDSYYRLSDWMGHLQRCTEGLKQHLGDADVEDTLTKEMAAVLDTDILAETLGEDTLREMVFPLHLPQAMSLVTKKDIKKLELEEKKVVQLLEVKEKVEVGLEGSEQVILSVDEDEILRSAAQAIQGKRLVERMRTQTKLPESLEFLDHVHELVLNSEDGLKTYLMLLYGQIQNRDLHLLRVDQKEIPLAEKRLAVAELEYYLSKLSSTERYRAFEAARTKVSARQPVPPPEWQSMRGFLQSLVKELASRLERIASFEEIVGLPADYSTLLCDACSELRELDQPEVDQYEAVEKAMSELVAILRGIGDIKIVVAPPQTVSEIEDFLNMMG